MNLCDINIRDPYILKDNDTYYMYGSRAYERWDSCTGLDVYVSKDLKEWSDPIEVFSKPEGFWADRDFWAPEVHKYKDEYYMFVTFYSLTRSRGTQILKSKNPTGPFVIHSDGPVTPNGWMCLDGTLYVENSTPYIIFCHEWVQVKDGEMWAMELSSDLSKGVGEPFLLFKASQLSGVKPPKADIKDSFVTDGPFMYKTSSGRLLMLWSSFSDEGYCEAISYSDNGSIKGKWTHDERMLFKKDGGHGMLFEDKEGRLKFILHSPNARLRERPVIYDLCEKNNSLYIQE